MNLQNKVVVITGGASGFDRATAEYMVTEKGAKVALLDLNAEAGAEVITLLGENNAIFCQTDVTRRKKYRCSRCRYRG
ncbi:SDR family NAD(P)-dependent oxidoreductase [Colwellia sp. MSW7]|uniref:SDR family NAD(P)-dependent oxidoreductase n=1 Tax=Colwellia maritima TaxID=2912588 RepID=A0ABS9X6M7_9GAMM|nr:SDR family NAD(P)-dependent oxidoreductase [Colwellia maritima]MCI2285889.1 SDR family NAD(P)-dependent oxidoreductase [Colwellia maritima]